MALDPSFATLTVEELMAMVLADTPESAERVLAAAGGLAPLALADPFEVAAWLQGHEIDDQDAGARGRPPGDDVLAQARAVAASFELGRRLEIARADVPPRVASPAHVAAWATPRIAMLPHEELWMLGLDGRGRLRAARCVAKGGLHGAAVHAADPLRAALRVDASAFLLVHNHPSGDPTPSPEDVFFTARVAAASYVVGCALLDHVIVARDGFDCVPIPVPAPAKKSRRGARSRQAERSG